MGGTGIGLAGYYTYTVTMVPHTVVTTVCSEDQYRYGHNGKFKDNEWAGVGNHYDFGARTYDTRIARWINIDPLYEKYPSVTAYNFALNSPIGIKDDDGRDIIILSAPHGAMGFGHAAVLIQNEKRDGWVYYSKNGTHGSSGSHGASNKNPRTNIPYASLQEFANSKDNQNDENPDEPEYSSAFRIKTTPEQDKKMREVANRQVCIDYHLFGASCVDVASDALRAAGLNPGAWCGPVMNDGKGLFINERGVKRGPMAPEPNVRYGVIRACNIGVDVTKEISRTGKATGSSSPNSPSSGDSPSSNESSDKNSKYNGPEAKRTTEQSIHGAN